MLKEFYLKDGKYDIFSLSIMRFDEYSISFIVHEITGWSEDNEPAGFEDYLSGTIKWDGCSHIWFGEDQGDKDGYIHMCGVGTWKRHCMLMEWIYKTVFALFENADESEKWSDVERRR